jgi:hypothetical protein
VLLRAFFLRLVKGYLLGQANNLHIVQFNNLVSHTFFFLLVDKLKVQLLRILKVSKVFHERPKFLPRIHVAAKAVNKTKGLRA